MNDEPSELEKRLMNPVRAVKPELPADEESRIEEEARKQAFNLLFEQGLYAGVDCTGPVGEAIEHNLREGMFRFDAYCVVCKRETTFRVASLQLANRGTVASTRPGVKVHIPTHLSVNATCQRDFTVYSYVLRFEADRAIKIGQWPATAELAFGELKAIDKSLSEEDRRELGKALGLHAHDTAIGAFVYLRRVFERMVLRAHERQSHAGNPVEGFDAMRMDERIAALKQELPEKVVKNSAVFSVLSVGLHELTEEQCAKYFPVLKAVLFEMLEQEEHKRKASITARDTEAALSQILSDLGAKGATRG